MTSSGFSRVPILEDGIVTAGAAQYYQMLLGKMQSGGDQAAERLEKSLNRHLQHQGIIYVHNAGPETSMQFEFTVSMIKSELGAGVLSSAVNYGWGRFEGMKFIGNNGKAYFVHPDDNFDRMRDGAKKMNVPFDFSNEKLTYESILIVGINGWLQSFPKVGKNRADKIYIRPLDSEMLNTGIGISGRHFNQLAIIPIPMAGYFEKSQGSEGVNVLVWDTPIRQAFATIPELALKNSCGYTYGSLLKDEANAVVPNAGEAIIFNNGFLKEGTSDTVMIIKNGVAYVPPLETGRLNATTATFVRTVLEKQGVQVIERNITLAETLEADAIFLLGNAVNFMGVNTAYVPMEAVCKYSAVDSLNSRKGHGREELTVFGRRRSFAKIDYNTTEKPIYSEIKKAFEKELLKYCIAVDDVLVPGAAERLADIGKRIRKAHSRARGRADTGMVPDFLREDAKLMLTPRLWPSPGTRETGNSWSAGLRQNTARKIRA